MVSRALSDCNLVPSESPRSNNLTNVVQCANLLIVCQGVLHQKQLLLLGISNVHAWTPVNKGVIAMRLHTCQACILNSNRVLGCQLCN